MLLNSEVLLLSQSSLLRILSMGNVTKLNPLTVSLSFENGSKKY
uniref:Uncharacterized protein n=1 Tax=Anopheles minimus TaxID=112268 RepID=A0A182WPK4_9DIPT